MEERSHFLFYLFIILSPFAILFGIYFRKFKYSYHILFAECIFILICLTIACFQDSEPHYLLGMTKFQELILFLVGISYVIDSTDIIISLYQTNSSNNLTLLKMHHIPCYIGILYMLYVHQCGGIIVRLLFDSIDYTLQLLDFITNHKYEELLEDLQNIAYFFLRTCYYSILGVYGVYVMICHWDFIDKFLFTLYFIWIAYALYDHIYLGFVLEVRFELKKIFLKWFKGIKEDNYKERLE